MDDARDFIDQRRVYPPANVCIYCGAGGELTDEHTFPDGLGGRHVLPKASCRRCQKIINEEFEQYCMRTLFSNMRALFGMRSSKKRKPVRVSIKVRRGQKTERVFVDPAKVPQIFSLPVFPEPFFLTGEPVTDTFNGAWWNYQPNMTELLDELKADALISETIYPNKLARFVAKIAHAHAWALWGPVFEPFLVPIILGQDRHFIRYVGGWVKQLDPDPELEHKFRIFCWRSPANNESYLVADMRFFVSIAGPAYYAVIGRVLQPWPFPERQ